MKEISELEYTKLRTDGVKLIGRVIPHNNTSSVIYYTIDEEQKNLSCTEILDTLKLTHPSIKGMFDVIRYWAYPEIKTINYKV